MGTIKDKLTKLLATKAAIKAAIIGKGQTIADTDPFSTYPDKIAAIETGIDTSDATATESVMLAGETAYARGAKITGNIPSKSASDLTASGATVTAPAGYYPSAVSKSVATATQDTLTISNSSGKITASFTQSAGYVESGTKSATLQLTTKAATTYTPGTSNQTIASGQYLTGTQTIKGDANLVAANIKSGISIFGVSGSYTGDEIKVLSLSSSDITCYSSYFRIYASETISELIGFAIAFGSTAYYSPNGDPLRQYEYGSTLCVFYSKGSTYANGIYTFASTDGTGNKFSGREDTISQSSSYVTVYDSYMSDFSASDMVYGFLMYK